MRALPVLATFLAGLLLHPASAAILAQWVQLGPDSSASVRVITDTACPEISLDCVSIAMRLRPHALWLWLGPVVSRFLPAGGAAARRRTLGHGARQSRGLRTRRRGLVPLPRSRADGVHLPRSHRHLRIAARQFRRGQCRRRL